MFISLYFIVNSTWNQKQCPWNQTIFLPYCLSSCMLHLMTINCSTFSGFKEVLLGVTSQLWLHWGLQTSVDLPGQAWASRVGDIRPPLCNCSQSPIFWHLLALSNIESLSSLKLLKASEIANCCVWQLHVFRADPQCCCSRLWPLILILVFHSVH